ncbi:aldose epimerase family protein [Crateriforma spongiae]|uniref:aldose epimerase family protein n=1 Tax=Crateriforma spongiae TaxID=2724528 RepID=UPI0014489654|nr:aldose epimerase family protein [Crateriforma spongiae]
MKIQQIEFGKTADQQVVSKYVLTNSHGNEVGLMDWGASLLQVVVPDRSGESVNVNCAFDSLSPYLGRHPYFGSTIGRFCNRIEHAKFTIDDVEYPLDKNHGDHQLHGGADNFSHRLWRSESFQEGDEIGVRFRLTSPDGDQGFPGTLTVVCEYRWNDRNELSFHYEAQTDKPTHVNLTNHSYWNLSGMHAGKATDHIVQIEADQWLDVDADLIPTGKLNDVSGTPLDFRQPTAIGKRLAQLPDTNGYDHCYVVRGKAGTLRPAGRVIDPASGRTMDVETTQVGMQLYSANHLPGDDSSAKVGGHEAFCMETQHYPNAPNRPMFPTTLLVPGSTLRETTLHRFGVLSD